MRKRDGVKEEEREVGVLGMGGRDEGRGHRDREDEGERDVGVASSNEGGEGFRERGMV